MQVEINARQHYMESLLKTNGKLPDINFTLCRYIPAVVVFYMIQCYVVID